MKCTEFILNRSNLFNCNYDKVQESQISNVGKFIWFVYFFIVPNVFFSFGKRIFHQFLIITLRNSNNYDVPLFSYLRVFLFILTGMIHSFVAFVSRLGVLTCFSVLISIYSSTTDLFPGAVFLVCSSLIIIALITTGYVIYVDLIQ